MNKVTLVRTLQFVGNSIKLPGRFTIIDYICSGTKGGGKHGAN